MMRILPVVIALGAILISGFSHALLTNRWGASEELRLASERLGRVPTTVGDWVGEAEEMDPAEFAMADIEAYRKLRFVNKVTRAEVQFLLVCGRPGPVSVHTPNICYLGAGFKMVDTQRETFEPLGDGQPFQVQSGLFLKEEANVPEIQRAIWTFSVNGDWKVPDNPRVTFARDAALYKLYVARPLAKKDEPLKTDPAVDLLRQMIPQLQKVLFEPSPGS